MSSLHLVTPKIYPHAEATARASGADDLLQRAQVHESLEGALAGCGLVLGTSARLRSLPLPLLDARRAAGQALAESARHEVALLFGRERYGLTNEEIQRCHFLVNIPSNPEYSSLNIAQAVQIMAYELRIAAQGFADIELRPAGLAAGRRRADGAPVRTPGTDPAGHPFPESPAAQKRLMARLRRLVQQGAARSE